MWINTLSNYLSSLPCISQPEAKELAYRFTQRSIRKKEILSQEGHLSPEILFVCKGLIRSFVKSTSGKDITTDFAPEGLFLAESMSFPKQIPALFSVQAIENGVVLSVSRADLHHFFDHFPSGDRIGRLVFELQLEHVSRRHLTYRSFTPEERFNDFRKFYPDVLKRAPSYMVASFLGISRATLYRLQAKNLRK